ncbi:Do family serine endopeptidase [Buchnera aphidicola]|uniref:Serine endoprotease DegP n=1 Tax=Buchnera aphidicola subsp. Melaphis rhois TaxID=118103 RepID=A0A4D6Y3R4_BUCMH|nr:Do family serine endopeptidase [Buchnera aphidicola]QCI23243.1 serine endoprotease DegP [Buchnera aphidicola (Melaphis rhois)]
MKTMILILRKIIPIFVLVLLSLGLSWSKSTSTSDVMRSESMSSSLAPMLEQVMPSVVSISVEGNTVRHSYLPHQFHPFFGDASPLCQKESPLKESPLCQKKFNKSSNQEKFYALGSGVIINARKGYVVTNNHVIDHANKIQVQLSNGSKYSAKIIGRDARFDIALIQLNEIKNLKEIKVSDSNSLRVGDYVIAIGNPYGLGETVTSGIISALNRSGLNIERYENFIQTDAAINRGNSGGALINLKGELIGINTAILAPDGGNIGIGFAIPVNIVKSLTNQMIVYGQVYRNELGVIGSELNSDLAKVMKLNISRGAFISRVLLKSSADVAGIKPGDVIISLNKKPIFSFLALRAEIASLPVNTKMELGLLRDGIFQSVIVELKPRIKNKIDSVTLHASLGGAEVSDFYVNGQKKGIYVDNVKKNTNAFRIGLRKNDIIIDINKHFVPSLDSFRILLRTKPEVLVFHVKRGSEMIYLVMQD